MHLAVRSAVPCPTQRRWCSDLTVVQYGYDKASNVVSITDPLSAVTTITYDALNRQTVTTLPDPDGAGALSSPTRSVSYDDRNQVVSSTNEIGAATSFFYDNMGRRTQVTQADPDGAGALASPVESFVFDAKLADDAVHGPIRNGNDLYVRCHGPGHPNAIARPDGTGH